MEGYTPFEQAVRILPQPLRQWAMSLSYDCRERCEELRLRAGQPLFWWDGEREQAISRAEKPLSAGDLAMTVELATRSSYHWAADMLRQGYVPLPGGHRLGVTGTAVIGPEGISGFRRYSALNLRIARDHGVEEGVLTRLMGEKDFESTLILSPPGLGKTTLLRAMIRRLSGGESPLRVGLTDQRGEVAAMVEGVPQLDVGTHTDVLEGGNKAEGMLMLLRSMNPQVLAVDEITSPEDVAALTAAVPVSVPVSIPVVPRTPGAMAQTERMPSPRASGI